MVFFLSQFLESQPVCFKIAREQFLSSSSRLLLPVLLQWLMGLISLGLFIPILSFTQLLPWWLSNSHSGETFFEHVHSTGSCLFVDFLFSAPILTYFLFAPPPLKTKG